MSHDILSAPISFYWPEEYLFPKLQEYFEKTGVLDPLALYVILDWKASRAKTKHLNRLKEKCGGDFRAAAERIGRELFEARSPKERLGILLRDWGFRLPTATAILSVLYPHDFTVYDVRVCEVLHFDGGLGGRQWSDDLWDAYTNFRQAVRNAVPDGKSYRECDRWLWGISKREDLSKQISPEDKDGQTERTG